MTRSLERLHRAEARLLALADAMGAILGVADAGGVMLHAPGWEALTGQPPAQYGGLGWLEAIHPDDRADAAARWQAAMRDSTVGVAECRVRRRDGSYLWVSGRVVPVRDEAGRVCEWLVALHDIDAARRAADEVQASEMRLRRIVDSDMIGLLFWTPDGLIVDANDAFLEMAGRTREELRAGRLDWRALVTPDRVPAHEAAIAEIYERGISSQVESVVVRPDGGRVPILCAGASLGVEPFQGVTWVLDLSERKRIEREREELLGLAECARREAEQANRAKDEFLAMLGHELRNPLAAVRHALAAANGDEATRARALVIAERQSEQLTRLIDDLLDVARITHGRIPLREERVAVADLLERALEATRSLVEGRPRGVEVSLPPAPLDVRADPARLEQVIVNLLVNALKYTPPDGRITLAAERDGAEAVVRVRDTGVGIAADVLPRVFDLFAQADRSLDRAQSGLGLGLTLVKRIVELHGGRVEARSPGAGGGSEFCVRLPALGSDPPAPPPPRAAPPAGAPLRMLVVEDNPDAAESLLMLLALKGHRVTAVPDGLAALAAARAERPDVLLVDIGLPGIDGYEVARRIREDPDSGDPLLVALTGYGRDEDRRRALAAGFDQLLVKPVDLGRLDAVIARAVPGR
jgi:two-component system CheB/CheR fusion protein